MKLAKFNAGPLLPNDIFLEEEFAEEAMNELREKKLVELLSFEMQNEPPHVRNNKKYSEFVWSNYEAEETQLKVQLSDMLLEYLLRDTVEVLHVIKNK